MAGVRILAISDVKYWDGYELLLRKYKPSVVVLAGDLVDDGFANLCTRACEVIPGFIRRKKLLLKKFGISGRRNVYRIEKRPDDYDAVWNAFRDRLDALESQFEKTKAYANARWRLHVGKF